LDDATSVAEEKTASCDVIRGPSLLRTSLSAQHRPRPSLFHLPGLRSLPFWTQQQQEGNGGETSTVTAYRDPEISSAVQLLEAHWETILEEYLRVAPTLASDYQTDGKSEHGARLHRGTWEWHSYMLKGAVQPSFENNFPETSRLLQTLRDKRMLFEGTPFGYAFFSTLHANSSIDAHTAPMNLRLRIHLPLLVPEGDATKGEDDDDKHALACGIQVGPLIRPWIPGKALVLDDAFLHRVWNKTSENRVLLLVDVWHPDVSQRERSEIVGMFRSAQQQGWLKKPG
jgi:aspartate beta-hydroxylase